MCPPVAYTVLHYPTRHHHSPIGLLWSKNACDSCCQLAVARSESARTKQESCAVAKMTAQCALYGALKKFMTPWLRPRLLFPTFFMDFCSDRLYECSLKIWSPYSFTCSWDKEGIAKLQAPHLEEGKAIGVGMVPFERALVSSYRPSIVTLPLSLRVSEILPLLFSRTPLFPYPTSIVSPKFPHVPLGVGGSRFRYKEWRRWANCPYN